MTQTGPPPGHETPEDAPSPPGWNEARRCDDGQRPGQDGQPELLPTDPLLPIHLRSDLAAPGTTEVELHFGGGGALHPGHHQGSQLVVMDGALDQIS